MLIYCLKEDGPGRDNKEVIFQVHPVYDVYDKFNEQCPSWVRYSSPIFSINPKTNVRKAEVTKGLKNT